MVGFRVKIVERTGTSLKSLFPTNNLWDGQMCEREDCTTCQQGAEMLPNCTKSSVLYENVCGLCNPKAGEDKELTGVRLDIPTLYVGESSRTIYERSKEHWSDWRSKSDSSHMWKHQMEEHRGEEPKFYMRVVDTFKTALSRQIAEAVRIRRRGGAGSILNSKAEFNRCRIPRLVVEEQDTKQQEEEEEKEQEELGELLNNNMEDWDSQKTAAREQEDKEMRSKLGKIKNKSIGNKREQEDHAGATRKRRKKLKYAKEQEDWGEQITSEDNPAIEDNPPIWELPPLLQPEVDNVAPTCELPPLPQREHRRRSRQRSLLELLVPVKTSEAPGGEPLKPAGTVDSCIGTTNLDTGCMAVDIDRGYLREDNDRLKYVGDTIGSTTTGYRNEEGCTMEYNKGGIDLSTTPSMDRVQLEKAPSGLSGGPDVELVDKTENIEKLVDKTRSIEDWRKVRKTNTTGDMSTNTTDGMNTMHVGSMKCTFDKDDTCVIHNIKGTVMHVTTKKWKKNVKTGLFGNVSTRSRKLQCKARKITPVVSKISTDVQSQR